MDVAIGSEGDEHGIIPENHSHCLEVHTGSGRVVSSERYVDVLERQKRARENMEACFWSFNHPTTCCVLHIGSSTSKKPSARIADQVHGMIQLEKNSEYH
ncbi:uncharacterized protein LJ206_012524 isoform 3-T3 [Theristicus caerulescens]